VLAQGPILSSETENLWILGLELRCRHLKQKFTVLTQGPILSSETENLWILDWNCACRHLKQKFPELARGPILSSETENCFGFWIETAVPSSEAEILRAGAGSHIVI
jgi:hypothetical protein